MTATWYYPDVSYKRAPRNFRCTDCRKTIERGRIYFRMNHGRYCSSCGSQYLKK